jgi:hypothetical protein
MRRLTKALIAIGIGVLVNALVLMGIFAVPCASAPYQTNSDQKSSIPAPAFGSLSDCSQARTGGFIILGLADAFAAIMVASELSKHGVSRIG